MRVPIRAPAVSAAAGTLPLYAISSLELYRQKERIDRNALDIMCETHCSTYREIADCRSLAASERDRLKNELAKVDAQLANAIRGQGKKMSQGEIYDNVILDPKHDDAERAYLAMDLLADQWGNLVKSFEQRSRMLGNLTQQFSSGYFTVGTAQVASQRNRFAEGNEGRLRLNQDRENRK